MPQPTRPRFRPPLVVGLLLAACAVPHPAGPPSARGASGRTVETCVIADGQLRSIRVEVDAATGDTTFRGVPLHSTFPLTRDYAAEADWYLRHEPIPEAVWPHVNARGDYEKYAPPRPFPADSLIQIGWHHGVGLYIAPDDASSNYGILYIPVRPGCWFQLYQFVGVGEVRDG